MKLTSATLILAVASARIAVGANQLLLRNLDLGNQGVASLLTSDNAGNLFAVSTFQDASGLPRTRVIKTDPNGSPLANFDFPGRNPAQAVADAEGSLVVAGLVEGGNALANFPLVNPLFPALSKGGAYLLKLDAHLQGIVFSTLLNTLSAATALALDATGNIYVTGTTTAADFPVTPGAYQTRPPSGATYGFLTEISPNGDKLLYSTYFGGDAVNCIGGSVCVGVTAGTEPLALAIGPSGAVVIAGETTAGDLPVSPGAIGEGCACTNLTPDGFLAEFSAGKLSWSTYVNLGSALNPVVEPLDRFIDAVALDAAGDVIIGGKAELGLATTAGVLQPTLTPYTHYGGFLARITGSGTNLAWMTWLGGSQPDGSGEIGFLSHVSSLALDPRGQIVATGFSQTSQLPSFTATPVLGPSYVARATADGASLTELFAGPQNSAGAALTLMPTGNFVSLGPSGSMWIETASTSGPSLLATANAANGPVSGLTAPTEILSLYGIGIGPPAAAQGQITGGIYSSSLDGYQVQFDRIAAPLLYAGPTQINVVVPQAVSSSDYTHVQLVTPSGVVDGPTLAVRVAAPYIFQYGLASPLQDGTTSLAAALNQDGTVNSPQNPAKAGEIVTIFASGGGYLGESRLDGTVVSSDPSLLRAMLPVSVLSDPLGQGLGTSLNVLYAGGAPEEVYGLMQINFQLPATFPATSYMTYRFALQVGGTIGGAASVAIAQQP